MRVGLRCIVETASVTDHCTPALLPKFTACPVDEAIPHTCFQVRFFGCATVRVVPAERYPTSERRLTNSIIGVPVRDVGEPYDPASKVEQRSIIHAQVVLPGTDRRLNRSSLGSRR
jgi:hypothetical protein